MSLRHYILVFAVAFTGSFFLAGCLNDDNKIPPNCYDGILNNEEQLVDCGGPCEACFHCIDGIWQPQLGETCVDCGGECGACTQCRNCIQDGDESGIDCGGTFCGPCAVLCDDGILNGNEEQIDCGPNCEPCPTCDDLLMNGNEVGIDCGGTLCAPCITDGSCINSVLDGDEFWINCGGSTCPNCDTILSFKVNNLTHVVLANNVTFSFDGAALNVAGTSLQGGTIQISTNVPPAGWVTGATVTMNQTTIPISKLVIPMSLVFLMVPVLQRQPMDHSILFGLSLRHCQASFVERLMVTCRISQAHPLSVLQVGYLWFQ